MERRHRLCGNRLVCAGQPPPPRTTPGVHDMADTTATTGQISLDDFRSALLVNWDEAFTNVTGIFLDQGTSMFETLATISAEEASRPVGGGCATIAAQVNHTWFYLDLMNRLGRGED